MGLVPGTCARGMEDGFPGMLEFREGPSFLWVIDGAQPDGHLGSSEWQECSLSVSALRGRPARPPSDFTSPVERDRPPRLFAPSGRAMLLGQVGAGVKLDYTVPTALSLWPLSPWLP